MINIMYWLRSIFKIESLADLEFLAKLYKDVAGELSVEGHPDMNIEWTTNPFMALMQSLNGLNVPFNIQTRLVGPQTVMAVSTPIQKLDKSTFEHPNKTNILEWADFIDEKISDEIDRRNDMCRIFTRPSTDLTNKDELLLAASLSEYATIALSGKNGFIFSHPKICYLSWFGLTQNDYCNSALMFDKDDGFLSPFMDGEDDESMKYLNDAFLKWKASSYSGDLQS